LEHSAPFDANSSFGFDKHAVFLSLHLLWYHFLSVAHTGEYCVSLQIVTQRVWPREQKRNTYLKLWYGTKNTIQIYVPKEQCLPVYPISYNHNGSN